MAFAEHYRISALGRLGATNPVERFSYGVSMAGIGLEAVWSLFENSRFSDIADDVRDFHGRAASKIANQAVLETVKIAKIGTDGRYIGGPKVLPRVQAGAVGTSAYVLPQNALAVSLNTGRLGPTGRGRFFLPMPNIPTDANNGFMIDAPDAAGVNASVEELIEALNNLPGLDAGDFQVVVASTKGYNTPVTSVRTGRVIDTIRSRRNKLKETYSPNLDVD